MAGSSVSTTFMDMTLVSDSTAPPASSRRTLFA